MVTIPRSALHELSGKVAVIMLALPGIRDVLEGMAGLDLPDATRADIAEALEELADIDQACRDSVALFAELRAG